MQEAEMIFKSENLICCSPKNIVSHYSFSSCQILNSPDDSNTEDNKKYAECLENPSSNCPNGNKLKKFNLNDVPESEETNEKICAEAAHTNFNAWKR